MKWLKGCRQSINQKMFWYGGLDFYKISPVIFKLVVKICSQYCFFKLSKANIFFQFRCPSVTFLFLKGIQKKTWDLYCSKKRSVKKVAMYFSKNGQIVSIVKSYFWSDSFILGLKWNFKYKPMRWLNQENPEMISFQIKLYLKYKRYICLIFLTILWTESKLSWYICDVIVTISRWRRKTKWKRSLERRGRDKYDHSNIFVFW